MGGYIRMDKDLEDDPRVGDLADELASIAGIDRGLARNAVIGGLYRLWRYGDTHLGRHNRLKGALHGAARISDVTALPALLLEKFPREWLRIHSDGSVELPDYAAKNALIDRDVRREKTRARVRKHREKKRRQAESENGKNGGDSGNAEEGYSVTPALLPVPVPEPGPDPEPPKPGPEPQPSAQGRENPPPPRAPLASAERRLAARERPPRTEAELIASAKVLAQAGNAPADIARQLGQFGATVDKVTEWLKDALSVTALQALA